MMNTDDNYNWAMKFLHSWRSEYSGRKCFRLSRESVKVIMKNRNNISSKENLENTIQLEYPYFYDEIMNGLNTVDQYRRNALIQIYAILDIKYDGEMRGAEYYPRITYYIPTV